MLVFCIVGSFHDYLFYFVLFCGFNFHFQAAKVKLSKLFSWEVLDAYFASGIVTQETFEKLMMSTLNLKTLPTSLSEEDFVSVMVAFERFVEKQEREIEGFEDV